MFFQILNACSFLVTVIVNAIAIYGAFGLKPTNEVSNEHPTPITPHRYTFLIWTVIYLLQFVFIIYSFVYPSFRVDNIGWLYFISFVLNCLWLLAFGTQRLPLSALLIVLYTMDISFIYIRLGVSYNISMDADAAITFIPVSMLLAWLIVATILNILILKNYQTVPMDRSDYWIAFIIIALLGALGGASFYWGYDIFFLVVMIWAIAGIVAQNQDNPTISTGGLIAFIFIGLGVISKILSLFGFV